MDASKKIQVSLVVAAWNAEETIQRTIRSALAQEGVSLEVLVVDDGSTDLTLERVKQISDPRLHYFSQENAGAASARNLGWVESTGEYVWFLDADDVLLPGALRTHLDVIESSVFGPVCFTYSRYRCVDERGRTLKISATPDLGGDLLNRVLDEEGWLIPSVCMYHRSIVEAIGGFDTSMRYHEDRIFGLRAAKGFPAVPVAEGTVLYMQSQEGKARRSIRNYEEAVRNQRIILERAESFLNPEQVERLRQSLMSSLCSRFLLYGQFAFGRRLYREENVNLSSAQLKPLLTRISILIHLNVLMVVFRVVKGIRFLTRRLYGRQPQRSWAEPADTD